LSVASVRDVAANERALLSFLPTRQVWLEQYPTGPSLAASVILTALENEHVGRGCTVLDLGCGTGILALACALVESDAVFAIDCDAAALQRAIDNAREEELDDRIHFVQAKLRYKGNATKQQRYDHHRGGRGGQKGGRRKKGGRTTPSRHSVPVPVVEATADDTDDDDGIPLRSECVDTVITNPPFGTKNNAGIDMQFLKTACRLARTAVYSFHKTATRDYILKQVAKWGYTCEVVAEMKFNVPATYKFHTQKTVDVEVDLIRVRKIQRNEKME
jgi:predicted RNA methylase